MTIYFTADSHYDHDNIINHVPDRPWSSVDEMNQAMIDAWNAVVTDEDDVYHLGDVAFANSSRHTAIVSQLAGTRHLVPGNHDPKMHEQKMLGWDYLHPPILELKVEIEEEVVKFVLCHYPMMTWNGASRGSIHLHGHSHGNIKQSSTRFDVGVDGVPTWNVGWNYGQPISAEQIVQHIQTHNIEYDKIDHHGEPR